MKFGNLILGAALAGSLIGLSLAQDGTGLTPNSPDPFLWLADIHGAKSLDWVKAQDDKTLATLKADPEYRKDFDAMLAVLNANDRIPMGQVDKGEVLNFWQDADHVRGVWRGVDVAGFAKAQPAWDVLLDVDALDKREHADWVWQGGDCINEMKNCLVRLSPGGGDASTAREYDARTKSFVAGGFSLPVAKSQASWVDKDTILFGTDFGPGSMTESSYPRIVKLWRRGEPLSAARVVFEGKASDVSVNPIVFRGPWGVVPLIDHGISFFSSEFYFVQPDGKTLKLPLPLGANIKGVTNGELLFTLRDAWTTPAGKSIPQGALVAFNVLAFANNNVVPHYDVLYAPGPRATVEDVAAGRDAVYAAIFENVTGAIHEFRQDKQGAWSDKTLDLPKGGSAHVMDADSWTPQVYFTFESFLKPVTLYSYDGKGEPREIKSEPARFDASGLVSDQFEAISADGTKIPYFLIHTKDQHGTAPTILYSYGGFELSLEPWYWNDGHRPLDAGQTWLAKGGAVAVANIRGGGEFGPAWHQAALKTHRQLAFDDFEAVASDLEHRGLATAKQIGSVGASNGGLLVSTTMVQRPDLFGAVVCQRPLIDMLRYTHYGAGASWVGEYGDPADPAMRATILKYSPYENLKPDVKYPPVLFITETSDDRVTPVFARMMAAKMEAMNQNVSFYESLEGGHGPGATHEEEAQMWALSYVYLGQKLGLRSINH